MLSFEEIPMLAVFVSKRHNETLMAKERTENRRIINVEMILKWRRDGGRKKSGGWMAENSGCSLMVMKSLKNNFKKRCSGGGRYMYVWIYS